METMVAGADPDQQAAWPWGWWLAIALLPPLLALAICHGNDAFHRAAFALKRRLHGRPRARLPPGHMGLPFVGEKPALTRYFSRARRPNGFVHDKKRSFGVCWPAPDLVGASSILNVDGARHGRLRACVVEAVNRPSSLRSIARAIQPRVAAALRTWARKSTVTAAVETKKVTFENICKMFVSIEPSPLTEEMDAWFAGLLGGLRAFPLDLPGTAFRRALRCRRKLSAVFRDELRRRKDETDSGDDLMSALMRTEDEGGRLLSDEEVVDNIVSLVLAGYQSTAAALMWAVYLLAKTPHALAKLREENAAISRDKNGEFITPDDIPKMKYTAKVVEETLRVANIAAMVHRVALKDVEYRGYTIPQGWRVVVWLRSLHTDPNYYDDPLRFNPDRWEKPPKPGTYQVFGGGHRMCAGNMLARLQLIIMLHHLSVGYKWELLNPDAEIERRVERYCGSDPFPASTDAATGIASKDHAISPDVAVRLYLPPAARDGGSRIPVLVYFHGGGFCLLSAFNAIIHGYLNSLAARARAVVVSVEYRLAPEHPIPAAYEDSWRALAWVASHASGAGEEAWLAGHADFSRLSLAGESAGANIAHHMAMRAGAEGLPGGARISGAVLVHPYFLSDAKVPSEENNPAMADNLVDVLRDRGRAYCEGLRAGGWAEVLEVVEAAGQGHCFHQSDHTSADAVRQDEAIARFLNL
ncbi:ent-kaurenoic acid oxidase 1-like [Panicum miliaceum]|uniref:Ent-kaurenoic acid oxidase 1-like n=1 Tax=Panicum miliaceum TaxID=4540 RepID=A0A3L6Q449_PANMI|nr:ent-kaurenoic acid oxidase 1-like [Panicum miliaceum]